MKIKYYTDPGHGWIAVKRKLLVKWGVDNAISPCSYQKGDTVYLEEDRDAVILIERLRHSEVIEYVHKHTDERSPIRSYEPYAVA